MQDVVILGSFNEFVLVSARSHIDASEDGGVALPLWLPRLYLG